MGGGTAVIDMLAIPTATKTITSIALNDTNTFGALHIDLAGLSVAEAVTPPAPAPKPQCIRPGASCNTPAAENSQAWKWQPALPGAINTNPHSK